MFIVPLMEFWPNPSAELRFSDEDLSSSQVSVCVVDPGVLDGTLQSIRNRTCMSHFTLRKQFFWIGHKDLIGH